MKGKEFNQLAREYFGRILEPKGFSCGASKYCTFYRKASEEIYHLIVPDLSRDGSWFDIRVFATSPLVEPQFAERFPDDLGIPSDSFSLLHARFGVGARQQQFHCRTKERFIQSFNKHVVSALETKALPYLDSIIELKDLLGVIRREFYAGAALWFIGDRDEATRLLTAERARLERIHDRTQRVVAALRYIDEILGR